jgi:hypothetical protein
MGETVRLTEPKSETVPEAAGAGVTVSAATPSSLTNPALEVMGEAATSAVVLLVTAPKAAAIVGATEVSVAEEVLVDAPAATAVGVIVTEALLA